MLKDQGDGLILNFTIIQELMNILIMIIHLFLIYSDLKILLNTNKYDAGSEIKVNAKVRSSCWYKFLMRLSQIMTFLVVCEPLVILAEA